MNFKQKIWDFFKQKEDIMDRELVSNIEHSISELNMMVRNIKSTITDLEKRQVDNSNDLNMLTIELKGLKAYISDMDKVYSHKISKIEKK